MGFVLVVNCLNQSACIRLPAGLAAAATEDEEGKLGSIKSMDNKLAMVIIIMRMAAPD